MIFVSTTKCKILQIVIKTWKYISMVSFPNGSKLCVEIVSIISVKRIYLILIFSLRSFSQKEEKSYVFFDTFGEAITHYLWIKFKLRPTNLNEAVFICSYFSGHSWIDLHQNSNYEEILNFDSNFCLICPFPGRVSGAFFVD